MVVLSKGEQTRAKLRAAAIAVFARRGYHDTKVSDIVQEIGVSQPTFYSYFESKEAAYEELVLDFRQRLQALTRSLLIADNPPPERVVERVAYSFRRFLDFLAEDPALTEIGFFQPPGCTVTKEGMVRWVAANIAKEQESGLFRTDVPARHIARCLVGIVGQMARAAGSGEPRDILALSAAEIFCGGVWICPR